MRILKVIKGAIVSIACMGLATPQLAVSAEAANIVDVALSSGGTLNGHVVNAEGKPVITRVALLQNGRTVAGTKTNDSGAFALKGLPGGVFQVATANGNGVYRLWSPQTAPPVARDSLMLVDGPVVRGQILGGGPGGSVFGGQLLGGMSPAISTSVIVGGMVATAIAVPIATSNDNSDAS